MSSLLLIATSVGAQTWTDISANVPGTITSNNQGIMATDGTRLYVLGDKGVFVSSDGGNSFSAVNTVSGASYNLGAYGLRFIEVANGYVWVGADPGSAALNDGLATLHRLTPGETTWSKSGNGFPALTLGNQADDIAYDSSTGTYYVAGALGGAVVSSDGINWEVRNNGNGGIGLPATVEAFNGVAFMVRPLGGINRTVDQGVTWTATGGIPGPGSGTLLRLGNRILIATSGYNTLQDGVYFSDDMGVTWTFTKGLPGQMPLTTDGTLGFAAGNDFFTGPILYFSATQGTTWDSMSATGIVGAPDRLLKVGANLFVHTAGKLFRAPASSFNFTPATKIVKQPVSSPTLLDGSSYTFSVVAGGQNVSYQWKKGVDNVPGGNGPTLTFNPATVADSGTYTVVVTGDNGVVTSSAVTLTVVVPEIGKSDPTFGQVSPSHTGSSLVLDDFTVVALTGATVTRVGNGGNTLTNRVFTGKNYTRMIKDSSGRIVLIGTIAPQIMRLDPITLAQDTTFNPTTTDSGYTAIAEWPGRGYLVGTAGYSNMEGASANPVILLGYDGTRDTTFNTGESTFESYSNFPSWIWVSPDGKIYVRGGAITTAGLVNGGYVQRLNANGSVDTTFDPTGLSSVAYITGLRDGRMLVVTGIGPYQPRVLKPDGTFDATFNTANAQFNTTFLAAAEQADGKLIVGGNFTSYGGTTVGKHMRLNADGTLDGTYYNTASYAGSANVTSISYDPRGYAYYTPSATGGGNTFQTSGRVGLVRVFATPAAVSIWQQPMGGYIDQSGAVSLKVTAIGTGLTYQWYKNGQIITGATGATLNISAFDASKDGSYTVQVSNGTITETSQPAVLKSVGAPVIFLQPASANLITNNTYTLRVGAYAASGTTYQWLKNGQPVSAATNKTYTLATVGLSAAGRYSVVISNSFGSVTSDIAVITVNEVTGAVVSTFTPPTINGNVYGIQVLADKSVLIGGDFTTVGGVSHPYYAKLTSTGTAAGGGWTANPPGGATGVRVFDFEVLPDNQVMMGGDFTAVQGSTYDKLARLNTDGTVDTTYTSTSFGSGIRSIARLPDGKLLVGGTFTTPKQYLARMNSNGTLDGTFTLNADNWVFKVLVLSDGKVYVAGSFTTLGGGTVNRIARLNADLTIDGTFTAPVFNGQVQDLDVDGAGRVVVVGAFTQVDGLTRNYIARLNSNGALDTSFDAGTQLNSGANAVDVQFNGAIVVGGGFTGQFKRLLPTGAADPYFTVSSVPNGQVLDLETTPDGLLYVSGFFTTPKSRVAVYTTSKSDPAVTVPPQSVEVNLGGSTTLSASFYTTSTATYQWFKNGLPLAGQTGATLTLNNITKADAASYAVDVTTAQGTASSSSAVVKVLAEPVVAGHPQTQSVPVGSQVTFTVGATGRGPLSYQWRKNGVNIPGEQSASLVLNNVQNSNAGNYDVVVSNDLGEFTSFTAGLGVYAVVGGIDSSFNPGSGPDNPATVIKKLQNGNVAIGGNFSTVNSQTRGGFAILDNTGALVSLATNPSQAGGNGVRGIAQQNDGKILIGWYTAGVKRYNTDGTADGTFPAETHQIETFATSGNDLFIGGYHSSGVRSLRKFSLATGTFDTAFNANVPTEITGWNLYSICVQSDGKVLIGNSFGGLRRLNADGTADATFTQPTFSWSGGGSLKELYAIAQTADGKIWVGGKFNGVNGSLNQRYLVRLTDTGAVDLQDLALNGTVRSIVPVGNDVLVGGDFSMVVGSTTYRGVLRVKGSTGVIDANFASAFGNGITYCMELQPDGTVLVGGNFTNPYNRVARLFGNYNGTEGIARNPEPVNIIINQPFSLSVGWYGGSTATYQWYKNDEIITGATNQAYVVNAASAGDSGDYHVTVTTANNILTSASAAVAVSNPQQSYEQWKAGLGLIAGSFIDPDKDPDGDGIPNVAEFAFGTHPLQGNNATQKPKPVLANVSGTDYQAVQFIRNASAGGVNIVIEAAADVNFTIPVDITLMPASNLGNGLEQITVRVNTPFPGNPRVFFHVKVAQP
jgi:uncharacterized delta-60 repeat protein